MTEDYCYLFVSGIHSCLFSVMVMTPDCWSVVWGSNLADVFVILNIFVIQLVKLDEFSDSK